jgi:hypothetical protein
MPAYVTTKHVSAVEVPTKKTGAAFTPRPPDPELSPGPLLEHLHVHDIDAGGDQPDLLGHHL